MRGKIFRTTLMVTLITLVVCIGVVVSMFFHFFETSYSITLENEAEYIVASVEEYGIEYLQKITFDDVRVSYIASDGTVLYDSRATAVDMSNHNTREEFIEALQTGKGESERLSETLSERTYYISRKLSNGDVVRISDTRDSEWALVSQLFYQIVFVFLISVILSGVFSRRLSKWVTKPINEIDLSSPDKEAVYEELAPLLNKVEEQKKQIDEQVATLKKERREFASITSNMTEGFIVIDKNTNILSSNLAAGTLLNDGEPPKEGSIFVLEESERFKESVNAALDGKHENMVLEKNGRFISVFLNPVYEKKKVIGALLIFMDVTEKEGRESLRREFTANVSHELKTPLTSISLAAEMLKSGMVKSEDTVVFSERIYNEARRLINLVDDIIKLSRLDESGSKIAFDKADCALCVKKALDALQDSAAKKNIEITSSLESVKMECVAHLIEEMAYNLLSNAIKYTPDGGKVKIELKKDNGVVLSVSDTGIGIPLSEQERIFERFYRVDRSHTKAVEGTGLGLSIVKHAALVHGATVKIESEEGKGSTFSVVFK